MGKKKDRGCIGKQTFDTMEKAEAAARFPWKMLSRVGYQTAYKCRRCKLYHYGHPPRK
jgi:hypothetical protein